MTTRRFYSPPERFVGGSLRLSDEETRHLRDVLRLGVRDKVSVFDGEGLEFSGEITDIDRRSADIRILGQTEPAAPESNLKLTVAAAVLPGDKFDLVVQKLVELGIVRLIPLETIRADVKIKDAGKRLNRWRRIALEATKQCGRAKLMDVDEPTRLEPLLSRFTGAGTIFFSEREGRGIDALQTTSELLAVFGPKGGWDDAELELARSHGAAIITLGGRILRAETAAIALTAILQNRLGDLN